MDQTVKELLADYPFVYETPVQWGDMDSFQHLNNVKYFRHFENARVAYGRKVGITDRMETEGIGPILAWTECKFIRPVMYPDTLATGVRVDKIKGSEMHVTMIVVSHAQKQVVAAGGSKGVFYDYRNEQRVSFPKEMIAKMEELEGRKIPVEPE